MKEMLKMKIAFIHKDRGLMDDTDILEGLEEIEIVYGKNLEKTIEYDIENCVLKINDNDLTTTVYVQSILKINKLNLEEFFNKIVSNYERGVAGRYIYDKPLNIRVDFNVEINI
jgi:hypothetical protein